MQRWKFHSIYWRGLAYNFPYGGASNVLFTSTLIQFRIFGIVYQSWDFGGVVCAQCGRQMVRYSLLWQYLLTDYVVLMCCSSQASKVLLQFIDSIQHWYGSIQLNAFHFKTEWIAIQRILRLLHTHVLHPNGLKLLLSSYWKCIFYIRNLVQFLRTIWPIQYSIPKQKSIL